MKLISLPLFKKIFLFSSLISFAQNARSETIYALPDHSSPVSIDNQETLQNPIPSVQSLSRFFAGYLQGGLYEHLEKNPKWQSYRTLLDQRWLQIEQSRLKPMREWQKEALGSVSLPVFYPMGGPDVFNVLTFFPDSPEYILVGLERIGSALALENLKKEGMVDRIMEELEQGMGSLFQRSFFITKDMARDLYELGVLPTMLVLMTRLGYEIRDMKFVTYTEEGKILESTDLNARQGVEITFRKEGRDSLQKMYYFRQNLHNNAIKSFAHFMEARGRFAVMFKSSSYVPHQVGFSHLVNLVGACGDLIVQDDSGLPYNFLKKKWDITFYGDYKKPYGESFHAYIQPDLALKYTQKDDIQPLDFRIGYGYGKVPSSLQVGRIKEEGRKKENLSEISINPSH